MKWLSFKRTDDHVVYLREDDIDYIVTYDKKAKIYQKNGKDQIVCAIDILERLSSDDLAVIRRRSEILEEYLAQVNIDIQNRDDEIQDLKLENDRLKKRDELMVSLICDATCHASCSECRFSIENEPCKLNVCRRDINRYHELMNELYSVFEKLEDL